MYCTCFKNEKKQKSQLKPLKIDFGPVLGHPTTTSRSVVVYLFAVSCVKKETIPPVYVTLRAGTKTLFLLGSYSPHKLFKKFQL